MKALTITAVLAVLLSYTTCLGQNRNSANPITNTPYYSIFRQAIWSDFSPTWADDSSWKKFELINVGPISMPKPFLLTYRSYDYFFLDSSEKQIAYLDPVTGLDTLTEYFDRSFHTWTIYKRRHAKKTISQENRFLEYYLNNRWEPSEFTYKRFDNSHRLIESCDSLRSNIEWIVDRDRYIYQGAELEPWQILHYYFVALPFKY